MSDKKDEPKHFPTVTSTWTETVEKVIKNIGESCEGYKWMNIFAAKKASTRYNTMMYCLIFIGPISGILSTLSVVVEKDSSKTIQILVTIFSFVSGVVSTVIKYSKYEQKTSSHKAIAAKYASLEGNVRRQLSLCRNERVNAGDYLEWVSTSYDDLFTSTPLMPDDIYLQWAQFAKQNGLNVPKRLGQIIEVADDEYVANLSNVGQIGINNSDSSKDIPGQTAPTRTDAYEPTFEVVVQGPGTIKREKKRSEICNSTVDLNRYTDTAMQYEMRRMYNFK